MDRMFVITAGIDVHRDSFMVSIRTQGKGSRDQVETRKFETFHDSCLQLAAWLTEHGVECIGLESTGEYWRHLVHVLREACPKAVLWLVNPLQVKKVPGRKTDVIDSRWLSKLVMYGLVSPSFLPSASQEDLRRLTRMRTKVSGDRTRFTNRVIKQIEASGIKLASVCSDVLGKTGRRIIDAMLSGNTDPDSLAELACGTLRGKKDLLKRAVAGDISETSKFVLRKLLDQLDDAERLLQQIDERLATLLAPQAEEIALLKTVPGIDNIAAAAILAEIGPDMSVFPSADNLASWGGLSPGSNQSAGKPKNAPARKGDKYLRTILVQAAQSAVRAKGTFWKRKFGQLLPRLGHNKAIFAIARKILITIYFILRDRQPYKQPELAPPTPQKLQNMLKTYTQRLQELGFDVTLTPRPAPPSSNGGAMLT